jgi:cobalt-zinc-cadmium efflux system protein
LDGEKHVLTAHLVLTAEIAAEQLKLHKEQIRLLLQPYQLEHTTIEFEFNQEVCRDQH